MNPSSDSSPERGRRSRSPIRVEDSDSPASPPPDEQGVPTLPYGGFHHPDSPPPPRRHHSPSLLASLRRIIEDRTTPPALRALAQEQEKALQAKPSSSHFAPQLNDDMEIDSASPATPGRRCHSPPQTDEEDAQKKRPRTGTHPEAQVRSYAEALTSASTKTPQAPGPAAPTCSQANADPALAKETKYPPLTIQTTPAMILGYNQFILE